MDTEKLPNPVLADANRGPFGGEFDQFSIRQGDLFQGVAFGHGEIAAEIGVFRFQGDPVAAAFADQILDRGPVEIQSGESLDPVRREHDTGEALGEVGGNWGEIIVGDRFFVGGRQIAKRLFVGFASRIGMEWKSGEDEGDGSCEYEFGIHGLLVVVLET
mgnify:CR=1 FL=1